MKKYIPIIAGVLLCSCGNSDNVINENGRSYDAWMGSTYSQQISFAGGHYYKTSDNITDSERNTLIENNMAGLNLRAAKLVNCSLEDTPPKFNENDDYFAFIVNYCMKKLGM